MSLREQLTTQHRLKATLPLTPFHEKPDTDVNPESFAASKFFNCVSVAGR
ncbi:hypothetical protein [Nostoc sp. CMAA1605]